MTVTLHIDDVYVEIEDKIIDWLTAETPNGGDGQSTPAHGYGVSLTERDYSPHRGGYP